MAVTSLVGLAALAAGVHMLITASGTGLTVEMAAMPVLWLIATVHQASWPRPGCRSSRPGAGHGQPASTDNPISAIGASVWSGVAGDLGYDAGAADRSAHWMMQLLRSPAQRPLRMPGQSRRARK